MHVFRRLPHRSVVSRVRVSSRRSKHALALEIPELPVDTASQDGTFAQKLQRARKARPSSTVSGDESQSLIGSIFSQLSVPSDVTAPMAAVRAAHDRKAKLDSSGQKQMKRLLRLKRHQLADQERKVRTLRTELEAMTDDHTGDASSRATSAKRAPVTKRAHMNLVRRRKLAARHKAKLDIEVAKLADMRMEREVFEQRMNAEGITIHPLIPPASRGKSKSDAEVEKLLKAMDRLSSAARAVNEVKSEEASSSSVYQAFFSEPPKLRTESQGWTSEEWKDEWGRDELAPPPDSSLSIRESSPTPPHLKSTFAFKRKIEGFLLANDSFSLEDVEPPSEHKPVAKLSHGLDRVLFNPGVHWLRDPRSRVYNFSPYLEHIPTVSDFAFERISGYITSSKDDSLYTLAKQLGKRFTGSTSSLTGLLSHLYFLISADKEVDTRMLSGHFQLGSKSFTPGQRMPVGLVLRHKEGVYSVDSDSLTKGHVDKNVLVWQGTMLENFLTKPSHEFAKLMRTTPVEEEEIDLRREAYRYAKTRNFVMRSQLDCHDPRLPGTGVFDIKTRAALPIRQDIMNYEENSGYLIRTLQGPLESFEKEYYDLIRSAFLKYSYQVRIGNMDGVIVAYHNTARIFGFQYIPLDEMEERLYGGPGRGARVFEKCVSLCEHVLSEAISHFPDQSVRLLVEKCDSDEDMHVWIEPVDAKSESNVVQLNVSVTNYLGDTEVSSDRAISGLDQPWNLQWSIATSSLSLEEILWKKSKAMDRAWRALALPDGVTAEEMVERWDDIQFGPPLSEEEEKLSQMTLKRVSKEMFSEPSPDVRHLRMLARQGRLDQAELDLQELGKPKLVWGQPEDAPGMVEAMQEAAEAADPREQLETADADNTAHQSVQHAIRIDDQIPTAFPWSDRIPPWDVLSQRDDPVPKNNLADSTSPAPGLSAYDSSQLEPFVEEDCSLQPGSEGRRTPSDEDVPNTTPDTLSADIMASAVHTDSISGVMFEYGSADTLPVYHPSRLEPFDLDYEPSTTSLSSSAVSETSSQAESTTPETSSDVVSQPDQDAFVDRGAELIAELHSLIERNRAR